MPLNEMLARAGQPVGEAARDLWRAYADPWNVWNAVRMIASLAALLCVGAALKSARGGDRRAA